MSVLQKSAFFLACDTYLAIQDSRKTVELEQEAALGKSDGPWRNQSRSSDSSHCFAYSIAEVSSTEGGERAHRLPVVTSLQKAKSDRCPNSFDKENIIVMRWCAVRTSKACTAWPVRAKNRLKLDNTEVEAISLMTHVFCPIKDLILYVCIHLVIYCPHLATVGYWHWKLGWLPAIATHHFCHFYGLECVINKGCSWSSKGENSIFLDICTRTLRIILRSLTGG